MAYDLSNLPNAVAYTQQQQAQGTYTPSNGSSGLPSSGWDAWGGYNPSSVYGTAPTTPATGGNAPPTGGGYTPSNNGMGTPTTTTTNGSGGNPLLTQTSTPYTYSPGGPSSVPGGFTNANDIYAAANGQPNGVNNRTGMPAMLQRLSQNGTTSIGSYAMSDVMGAFQNPQSALGTSLQKYLTGGSLNPGTGMPLSFDWGKFMSDNNVGGMMGNQNQGPQSIAQLIASGHQAGNGRYQYQPVAPMMNAQMAGTSPLGQPTPPIMHDPGPIANIIHNLSKGPQQGGPYIGSPF